jgi:hypothetical protein
VDDEMNRQTILTNTTLQDKRFESLGNLNSCNWQDRKCGRDEEAIENQFGWD